MNTLEHLAGTRALWFSFIATIVCTFAFQVIAGHYGLVLLDTLSDPDESRAAIAAMTGSQRALHAWITGTLDVAYPAVYGALFVGSAYRFYPKIGRFLAAPTLLLVPVDLIEGLVQILGLTGTVDWLDAKAILTPGKILLFYFGLLTTVSGWGVWVVGRFRSNRSSPASDSEDANDK